MALSIGSSSIPPAFGPVNFSEEIGVFKSAFFGGIAGFLGAVLQGSSVSSTVGSGMVIGEIKILQVFIILFISSTLVIVSNIFKYPMPTAFTVIGAVLGSGFSFNDGIYWSKINSVFLYWLIIPFLAIMIAYMFSKLLRKLISSNYSQKNINYFNFIVGLFVAYTAGANSVGLAIGPLYSLKYDLGALLMLGGVSILIGAWLLSPRVIHTVSFEYSNIGPRRSISALGTAAVLAQIGVFFGIPISFSEAIIFSMIGSGLVTSGNNIGKKKLAYTLGAWFFAFSLSIGVSYLFSEATKFFF